MRETQAYGSVQRLPSASLTTSLPSTTVTLIPATAAADEPGEAGAPTSAVALWGEGGEGCCGICGAGIFGDGATVDGWAIAAWGGGEDADVEAGGFGSVLNSSCSMSLPLAGTFVLYCFPGFTSKSCSMMCPCGSKIDATRTHTHQQVTPVSLKARHPSASCMLRQAQCTVENMCHVQGISSALPGNHAHIKCMRTFPQSCRHGSRWTS
jgi:hypothetical protein